MTSHASTIVYASDNHSPVPAAPSANVTLETTSWVAVQALAEKHSIPLPCHNEVLQSLQIAERDTNATERQQRCQVQVTNFSDGVPFIITARSLENSRVLFRFVKVDASGKDGWNSSLEGADRLPTTFYTLKAKASAGISTARSRSKAALPGPHTSSAKVTNTHPGTDAIAGALGTSPQLVSGITSLSLQASDAHRDNDATATFSSVGLRSGDVLSAVLDRSQDTPLSSPLASNDVHLAASSANRSLFTHPSAIPLNDPRFIRWEFWENRYSGRLGQPEQGLERHELEESITSGSQMHKTSAVARRFHQRRTLDSSPYTTLPQFNFGNPLGKWRKTRDIHLPHFPSAHRQIQAEPSALGQKQSTPQCSLAAIYASRGMAIAATMPRLVAELTSVIDNRLMTNFFLTYRIFMTASQLLDSLIERFSIAKSFILSDETQPPIVVVRTYVVIKYWLQHFFEVDFLPDRPLRQRLTDWLNDLGSQGSSSSQTIVVRVINNLKKVVRGLKQKHTETGVAALLKSTVAPADLHLEDVQQSWDGSRPINIAQIVPSLALMPGTTTSAPYGRSAIAISAPKTPEVGEPSSIMSQSCPAVQAPKASAMTPYPSVETNVFPQDAFPRAFPNTLGRFPRMKRFLGNKGDGASTRINTASPPTDLLFSSGGVERLLSSLKILSQRQVHDGKDEPFELSGGADRTPSLGACSTASGSTPASSLDMPPSSPLFTHPKESASQHIDIDEGRKMQRLSGDRPALIQNHIIHLDSKPVPSREKLVERCDEGRGEVMFSSILFERGVHECPLGENPRREIAADGLHHTASNRTLRSTPCKLREVLMRGTSQTSLRSSTDGINQLDLSLPYEAFTHHYTVQPTDSGIPAPNIVQIDDIELSSDEDESVVVRALRRLPGARDLRKVNEFGNASALQVASSSSFNAAGITSLTEREVSPSQTQSIKMSLPSSSGRISDLVMMDPDDALAGFELVKGFNAEDFGSDDEDEPGDVEEALRRLEGFIDEGKRLKRAHKVEELWERSRMRQAARDQITESSNRSDHVRCSEGCLKRGIQNDEQIPILASTDEDDGEPSTLHLSPELGSASAVRESQYNATTAWNSCTNDDQTSCSDLPVSPPSEPSKPQRSHPSLGLSAVGLAVAQLQSRDGGPIQEMTRLGEQRIPPLHRSFLLDYKSDDISRHFTLIEQELFCAVGWIELLSGGWSERTYQSEVVDWVAFYKTQSQSRQDAKKTRVGGGVEAVVARFNLTCNWVASQVVLTTRIEEQAAVISKLIRIAFKCYQRGNFATLVEICLGLQAPWVERLPKAWGKVPSWEMRVFRDLKTLTSPRHDFATLRSAMREIINDGSIEELAVPSSSRSSFSAGSFHQATSADKGPKMHPFAGCVPFIGLLVSDLAKWHALPTYLDPTCPVLPAKLDTATGRLAELADPHAFDDANLEALPPGVSLEPMLNLCKMDKLGSTVKTMVALQQKALGYDYEAEATLYNKCLRLRCLDGHQMTFLSEMTC